MLDFTDVYMVHVKGVSAGTQVTIINWFARHCMVSCDSASRFITVIGVTGISADQHCSESGSRSLHLGAQSFSNN